MSTGCFVNFTKQPVDKYRKISFLGEVKRFFAISGSKSLPNNFFADMFVKVCTNIP